VVRFWRDGSGVSLLPVGAKKRSIPILPMIAGGIVLAFIASRLGEDNIDRAASRLAHALVTKDSKQLFSFVDQSERTALQLDEKTFSRFLELTIYKSYRLDKSADVKISNFSSQKLISIQDLSDPSGRTLPVVVVGVPGNFRVAGFVEFCLQACAMKEKFDPKLTGGSIKLNGLRNYLVTHKSELESVGINATYDPNLGIVTALELRIAALDERIANSASYQAK